MGITTYLDIVRTRTTLRSIQFTILKSPTVLSGHTILTGTITQPMSIRIDRRGARVLLKPLHDQRLTARLTLHNDPSTHLTQGQTQRTRSGTDHTGTTLIDQHPARHRLPTSPTPVTPVTTLLHSYEGSCSYSKIG